MKKVLFVLCAAALALVSCNKEPNPADQGKKEPVQVAFKLSATHPNGAGTKAVKTGWETGDVVFVFFSEQKAPAYLELKYDGEKWVDTPRNSPVFEEGETGTMTAVYLPFGNEATVISYGSSYMFSKTYLSYYLTDQQDYTVKDGEISGTFAMQIPEGYIQLFMDDANADASMEIEIREPKLTPQGIDLIMANGTIAHTKIAHGAPLPGYVYDKEDRDEQYEAKGWLFSGILADEARNAYTDYHYTLVIGGWEGDYYYKDYLDRKLYSGPQKARALWIPNTKYDSWTKITDYKPIDLGCDVTIGDGTEKKRIYWSSRNLGAASDFPASTATADIEATYGDKYAWGETAPKSKYNWDTYFDGDGVNFTKYATDKKKSLDLEDDAARVVAKGIWRMPSTTECRLLFNSTSFTWTWNADNGGGKFSSRIAGHYGRYIFLPTDFNMGDLGFGGFYWTRNLDPETSHEALLMGVYSHSTLSVWSQYRYAGCLIRPVMD